MRALRCNMVHVHKTTQNNHVNPKPIPFNYTGDHSFATVHSISFTGPFQFCYSSGNCLVTKLALGLAFVYHEEGAL